MNRAQACFSGNLETVKVLVEMGAKIDARDESQQTPKDVAERFEHEQVFEFMDKEAPKLTVEARQKYAHLGGGEEASKMVGDPMAEVVMSNEEANLERIVKTAAKVATERPLVAPSSVYSSAKLRQRQLMFGAVIFVATLCLGMVIGQRQSQRSTSRE
jgi:hypothetical protein